MQVHAAGGHQIRFHGPAGARGARWGPGRWFHPLAGPAPQAPFVGCFGWSVPRLYRKAQKQNATTLAAISHAGPGPRGRAGQWPLGTTLWALVGRGDPCPASLCSLEAAPPALLPRDALPKEWVQFGNPVLTTAAHISFSLQKAASSTSAPEKSLRICRAWRLPR